MTLASTTLPTWKLVAYISLVEVEAGLTALAHSAVHKANRVDGGKKGRSDDMYLLNSVVHLSSAPTLHGCSRPKITHGKANTE